MQEPYFWGQSPVCWFLCPGPCMALDCARRVSVWPLLTVAVWLPLLGDPAVGCTSLHATGERAPRPALEQGHQAGLDFGSSGGPHGSHTLRLYVESTSTRVWVLGVTGSGGGVRFGSPCPVAPLEQGRGAAAQVPGSSP